MENENETMCSKNIHMGHNVMKFRQLKGLKQDELGSLIGLKNQQAVSRLEKKSIIDVEILQKIAPALGVSAEVLQNMPEDNSNVIIENNTFENVTSASINNGNNNDNFANTYEPINKMMEFFKEFVEEERKQKAELMDRIIGLEALIKKGMK